MRAFVAAFGYKGPMANPKLGAKVRAIRRRESLTQAQLADRLGISTSYVNLIEHNHRPLTAPLLIKLATIFEIDLQTFAAGDAERLSAELLEVFSDPLFDDHDLTGGEVRELAGQVPAVGQAILTLYDAFKKSRETSASLAAHAPRKTASDEVSALIHDRRNHFKRLEAEAEALRAHAGLDTGPIDRQLTRHLRSQLGMEVITRSVDEMKGALRRFDVASNTLSLSEALAPHSRSFQLAHLTALQGHSAAIDATIDESGVSDGARALARVVLANYFAAAVMMPYARFLATAEQLRYDVERLCHTFHAGFEQVCHRLTTLSRPGAAGVPFHLVRVDIAGNISKRFSASGIQIARFSGACPRWNVHAAFMTPGRIRVQVSEMPDGKVYFCVARTVERAGAGFHDPHVTHAIGLGCRVEHAEKLVYADRVALEPSVAVKVGSTCRLCTRPDCAQRARPALQAPIAVDEAVRGLSFWAPVR